MFNKKKMHEKEGKAWWDSTGLMPREAFVLQLPFSIPRPLQSGAQLPPIPDTPSCWSTGEDRDTIDEQTSPSRQYQFLMLEQKE